MRLVLARWPLAALIASAVMLAAAHAFQAAGYQPCTLCLRQREAYWVAGALALAALVLRLRLKSPKVRALLNLALGLAFAVGSGIAVYHAGAEWKFWPGPSTCASGGGVSVADLAAIAGGGTVKAPSCDVAAWVFLGLSMAGWNAIISAGLAALSLAAARQEGKPA